MAWSASKIFTAYVHDVLTNLTAMDIDTDANIKVALFADSITPSQTVSAANSAYGAGVWASGGVSDVTGWPAVGRDLVTPTVTAATVTPVKFDADDTVSANATTTLAACNGCLVYDDTITTPVADQGICYNYFGGPASVTSGQFTIVWSGSGIMAFTL